MVILGVDLVYLPVLITPIFSQGCHHLTLV
jgi:hypothetical protein